ncbi:MAG TPA: sigma-70 family RNA polymerase sigma factor, partial [Acidimicrobiales bacterium]
MGTTPLSDAELIARARAGDDAAFSELYERHERAAHRLAATYPRAGSADDLVHGAFERVFGAIRRGAGPDEAFRAYLFVTLRRLAAAQVAATHAVPIDEVPERLQAEAHEVIDLAERALVLDAYGSLPDRMQAVLWQTEVEGRRPRELAPVLGMTANATAALASRAREKLRQAYLQAHLQASAHPECEPHRSRLGAYVRGDMGERARAATQLHVQGCPACQELVAELNDVNRLFVRALVPWFLAPAHAAGAVVVAGAAGA